jgi:hypothetical protein
MDFKLELWLEGNGLLPSIMKVPTVAAAIDDDDAVGAYQSLRRHAGDYMRPGESLGDLNPMEFISIVESIAPVRAEQVMEAAGKVR